MRQTYRIFCLLACVPIVLASCRGSNRNGTAASDQHIPDRFPMIEVPAMLSTPEERAQYVAAHYWDKFDFTDTAAYLDKPAVTEQGMADFLNILRQYVAPSDAAASLDRLLAGASADTAMFRYLTGLLEKYLYDPNSPMRSEELYIPVLRYLVASPQLDSLAKLRPRARLEMALKNRPGDTAADFAYVDLKGRSGRMHGLRSEYTVLFFNNPGCPACRDIAGQMVVSPEITQRVRDGRLTVLAVYPDEDLKAWQEHGADFPESWGYVRGRDGTLSEANLYDLKAIPTLYLLDRNKKVLLKDATFEQLNGYLSAQQP